MPLPSVQINIQNGALGQLVQSEDGLAGLILQSNVAPSGLALATPKLITSLQDAVDLGIDADFDSDNSVRVYKHIKEFYDEAGAGAKLYISILSQALTLTVMLDVANNHIKPLLDAAGGKIRILAVGRSPEASYSPTVTDEIDADVTTALTKANALAESYADVYKPFRVILEAREYTGDAGNLLDLKTFDKNRVAVMVGDTVSGKGAAVGLLLGRLSQIPVQRNVGRVKDGAVEMLDAFIGTATFMAEQGDITAIHDKGFITFRQYVGKAGYYFSDDPTATSATDDYNSFARGRVIDKALVIAYSTFVNEILDEVEIDAQGRIETVKAKYYQVLIENAVNSGMTANGEISSFTAQIDAEQNVLSTGKICVEARIVPVGYAKEIVVKLGFENPAISQ